MAEPLADISPNKVYGTSQVSTPQQSADDAVGMSSEGSDYSVIEYNIPTLPSSVIGGKHLRSVNNSPMKVTKKTKYDSHDDSTKENHDISFATVNGDDDVFGGVALVKEEEHTSSFDANLSGFSDIMQGAGISREVEEKLGEAGERSVDRQLLRESYRRERSVDRSSALNTPTKPNFSLSGSNRHSWSSPKSEPMTPGTVTPKANGLPSRLSALSQYSKSPESTPGRNEQTQNLLLDFTAQFNSITSRPPPTPTRSRRRSNSASPTKRTREGAESPNKQPAATPMDRRFLLDFDIPPPPTPRSIPSITPKELENIKSQYMAQIAQLKAELAGKDAQIQTLKDAVSDAERRASNGIVELRQVREEMEDMSARSMLIESKLTEASRAVHELREQLEDSGAQLDQATRDRETFENERDNYKKEVEKLRKENGDVSDALLKAKQELVSAKKELIFAQQKRLSSSAPSSPKGTSTANHAADVETAVTTAVAAANATKDMEISQAVEKVAKELHTLYKSKHEQKVTALKQSYQKRWEKRVNELEGKNSELTTLNNDLANKLTRMEEETEENLTGPIVSPQELEHQREEMERLKEEAAEARDNVHRLEEELQMERQEKGELVLAVDELLALGGVSGVQETGLGNLKGSISRASGVGIARGLSPVKPEKETRSSNTLRGGIERMGGGAAGGKGRFGFPK